MGIEGRTSLYDAEKMDTTFTRDFAAEKQKYEEAKAAAAAK